MRPTGARGDEHAAVVTEVALRGLLGRKLRAALTAFAIVIGVAMVSGTFVLTDTIKAAFTTVFTTVYQNTDAVITGKSAISSSNNGNAPTTPSLPASLLTQVRALPSVRNRVGRHLGHRPAGRPERQGDLERWRARPRLQLLARRSALQPAHAHQRHASRPARTRSTSTRRPPSKQHYKVGDEIGVVARGPVERFQIAGTVKIGGVSSLGGATISIFTLARAQQLFNKVGQYDTISVAAKHGYSPQQVVNADQAAAAGRARRCRTGQAAGAAGDQGHERVPQHLPGLPARVRRHRPVRRELRDRQHAVDHDRPAHARAGDAAHARARPAARCCARCWSRRS